MSHQNQYFRKRKSVLVPRRRRYRRIEMPPPRILSPIKECAEELENPHFMSGSNDSMSTASTSRVNKIDYHDEGEQEADEIAKQREEKMQRNVQLWLATKENDILKKEIEFLFDVILEEKKKCNRLQEERDKFENLITSNMLMNVLEKQPSQEHAEQMEGGSSSNQMEPQTNKNLAEE